jgi:hypothetical protein
MSFTSSGVLARAAKDWSVWSNASATASAGPSRAKRNFSNTFRWRDPSAARSRHVATLQRKSRCALVVAAGRRENSSDARSVDDGGDDLLQHGLKRFDCRRSLVGGFKDSGIGRQKALGGLRLYRQAKSL